MIICIYEFVCIDLFIRVLRLTHRCKDTNFICKTGAGNVKIKCFWKKVWCFENKMLPLQR